MEEEMMMKKKKKRKKEESSGMLSKLLDIEGEEEEDEEMMMVHMGGLFSKLPSDIFYDILSRVPIKSLSQCKWVCKTWFKIIYKPRFAELQYSKQIQTTRCSPFVVVANDFIEFYLLDSQVFDDFGTSTTAYSFKMKGMDEAYNRNSLKRVYQVVGSVNGLICLSDDPYKYCQAPYYICNPITGDHITLSLSPKYDIQHVTSAFGFSPITNEYKVVRILKPEFHKFKNGEKNIETEAEILTLGSDSWRRIQSFPYPSGSDHNLLLNGNLYWTTFKNMERVILSFNVATEEFDIIHPPPYVKQNGNNLKDLRVLGENLCFIEIDYDFQIEVWVMKKYGVTTSWAKEYVFKKKSQSNGVNLFWYKNYEVMKLWNGKLLLCRGQETLGYYDPNKGTFKPITVHEMPDVDYVIRPPIMLSGSLFSPKNVHKLRMSKSCHEHFTGLGSLNYWSVIWLQLFWMS